MPGSEERSRYMVQIWQSMSGMQVAIGENWHQLLRPSDEALEFIESASVEHYDLGISGRGD
jgi:hypothetical protein